MSLRNTEDYPRAANGDTYMEPVKKKIRLVMSPRKRASPEGRAGGKHVLFVMGGCNDVQTVETLDAVQDSWVSNNIPNSPSQWTWICSAHREILVLDWKNRRFSSFNVLTKTWALLRQPPNFIYGSSRSFTGQHIYVLGGEPPHGSRCDRYDIHNDRWEQMAPMRQDRNWAASVCHEGKLYCSGGLTWLEGGQYEDISRGLEVLDLRGNEQWSSLPSMLVKRGCHSLVARGRFLWAVGGWYAGKWISAVDKFDIDLCQWSSFRALPVPTSHFAASFFEERLYVIGGEMDGSDAVTTVFVYNEGEGNWTITKSLRTARRLHGSCVVWLTPELI